MMTTASVRSNSYRKPSQSPSATSLLESLCARLPPLADALSVSIERSVGDHVSALLSHRSSALQPRDDLLEVVHGASVRLLGASDADAAVATLEHSPSVLSANHHGVDYFAQSVQGTLALAATLSETTKLRNPAAVVLACAGIPLNNLTYPRGLISYLDCDRDERSSPLRIPVFPDRCKRSLVYSAAPITGEMVDRVSAKLEGLSRKHRLAGSMIPTLRSVLQHDYADSQVLALESYSQQATVLNLRLWRRMLTPWEGAPRLAYLELETVCSELLLRDLVDDSSLAHALVFDGALRQRVLSALNGARACWDLDALSRRLVTGATDSSIAAAAAGTALFWAVDEKSRRIPLSVRVDPTGKARLVGISDQGVRTEVTLEPLAVTQALKERRLLPSLFISYLCLALARGVNCLGGYYQAQYLPVMQQAVSDALRCQGGGQGAAQTIAAVKTDSYLSGMQLVCTENSAGGLVPAGPLEIAAAGGLSADDARQMVNTGLREAHLASIVDSVSDAARDLVGHEGWRVEVAVELASLLNSRVLVKSV